MLQNKIIGVIGLGYVGLPICIEFGKKFKTIGYDIESNRINELKKSIDRNLIVSKDEFKKSRNTNFTNKINDLRIANVYIITVPTPIYKSKKPDLRKLQKACILVAKLLKINDIVVFESTVYPGTTENYCVPILEEISQLKLNKDFHVGFSPERINPGDKAHNLRSINKVVSGSNIKALNTIANLYKNIIDADVYEADSIKVAEAAKIIENVQRDLNVALINELTVIFSRINIDIFDVLKAAKTKWNFINFQPGLVGGHCIGVDPYYLAHLASEVGIEPTIILAGRETNEKMSKFYAKDFINRFNLNFDSRILILGYTFKENCNDTRNTKVKDLILNLNKKIRTIDVYDPYVNSKPKYLPNLVNFIETKNFNNLVKIKKENDLKYDAIFIAVPHNYFLKYKSQLNKIVTSPNNIYDIKNHLFKFI